MAITVVETIKATREAVWNQVIDIKNAQKNLSSISNINILSAPENGIIGIKWEETRIMFGKEAVETMWISDAKEKHWYETTALNCGCRYNTIIKIEECSEGVLLSMCFSTTPLTFIAKIMSPIGFLFSGMIKKALEKDLKEIKTNLEQEK